MVLSNFMYIFVKLQDLEKETGFRFFSASLPICYPEHYILYSRPKIFYYPVEISKDFLCSPHIKYLKESCISQ